ncbi:aspartokinase-like uncharacterized kinase [Rhodoligotrophos appendicifer]|uniref:amino acid kinase family protein n=1 Tax=Rhodoligotrophos appendicifer TaxID=987056 RepID=UPI0011865525|nr:dihydroneopterin aldolase [Rhodoligotrophos appendicifer]
MTKVSVVKLGGSYARSAALTEWLHSLEMLGGRIVLVPGGGPFADIVRELQPKMGFSDAAAHHMALLAMEQYAHAICSLTGRLRATSTVAEINSVLREGLVPVWCPSAMALADSEIQQSWEVTSDSLAAWFGGQIGGRRLVLIKHAAPASQAMSVEAAVDAGLVDPALPAMLKRWPQELVLLGPGSQADLVAAVTGAVASHHPLHA